MSRYIDSDKLIDEILKQINTLATIHNEDCAGCEFNDIRHARCSYPGKWCVLYVRYRKDSE